MKLRVLFLCDDNCCRGQMAEGFLRSLAGDTVSVQSAGIRAQAVHPLAVKAMAEAGIDISGHGSRTVAQLGPVAFDLVITLCEPARQFCSAEGAEQTDAQADGPTGPEERTPLLQGAPLTIHWQVPDPAEAGGEENEKLEAFRAARDRIGELVRALIGQGILAAIGEGRRHLDSILDLLQDGVAAHDGKERRIYVFNRAAERITGYSREEIIGRDCHEVFPPDGLCGSYCAYREGDAAGETAETETRREHTVPFVARDGTVKKLRITAAATDTASHRPNHVVLTLRDVTELSDLRARLKDRYGFQNMVGVSKAMQEVFESIHQVSALDYPVLISGESGTGKELVARAIHQQSRRSKAAFVPINCGALPDHILESELFGHVRGAFTGATKDRKGRFQLADGGTLFLDEVEELSAAFQVKLLRVLQDMRFEPVGGERTVKVDVRVISATNRDLKQKVEQEAFREDLYYRLCVVPINLPPLRQRQQDIPFLVERFVADIAGETGKAISRVSEQAMRALLAYAWPGNVRELINALRFASIGCNADEILLEHLPDEVRQTETQPGRQEQEARDPHTEAFSARSHRRERLSNASVQQALDKTNGNKALAAKLLGVSRATLYRYLDRNPLS